MKKIILAVILVCSTALLGNCSNGSCCGTCASDCGGCGGCNGSWY
ncbi:hypothetical protein OQJ26_14030 [Legionella sp. PATHC038]|nr:hypothetical protein [Legionella sp. PATHC038]MCW8399907.1 hypothetical protein [Legionella sp. PATHC038]